MSDTAVLVLEHPLSFPQAPAILAPLKHLLQQPQQHCPHLSLDAASNSSGHSVNSKQQQVLGFSQLLQQVLAVSGAQLQQASGDLRRLLWQLQDAAGRAHCCEVFLPERYPWAPPTLSCDLPAPLQLDWRAGHTLGHVVQQVQQALAAYQGLWDELQLLDLTARVLHPPGTPSYSCCSRQLTLPRGAAVEVTLRPAAPRARPLVRFTGTSSAVAQLQQAWFSEGHVWDAGLPLRDNLQQALQVRLPAPKDAHVHHHVHGEGGQGSGWGGRLQAEAAERLAQCAEPQGMVLESQSSQQPPWEAAGGGAGQQAGECEEDAHLGECAICYAYLLQPAGAVPTEVCPGEHCRRAFHVSCLAEWLQSHPNSRRCFGTLFGDCPYCNGAIGVKVL